MKRIISLAIAAICIATAHASIDELLEIFTEVNASCPAQISNELLLDRMNLDTDKMEAQIYYRLTPACAIDLGSMFANEGLVRQNMSNMMFTESMMPMISNFAEAGLGLRFFLTDSNRSRQFSLLFSPAELREAAANQGDPVQRALAVIASTVELEKTRVPYSIGEGISISNVTDDGENLVYFAMVDHPQFGAWQESAKSGAGKQGILDLLVSSQGMQTMVSAIITSGRGIKYRYIDNYSGEFADIVITNAELRRAQQARQ